MCPRSLTLTPELVISVHPLSPYTHSLSVQVRGLFACSAASAVKYIEHLGHLEDKAQLWASLHLVLGEWQSGR